MALPKTLSAPSLHSSKALREAAYNRSTFYSANDHPRCTYSLLKGFTVVDEDTVELEVHTRDRQGKRSRHRGPPTTTHEGRTVLTLAAALKDQKGQPAADMSLPPLEDQQKYFRDRRMSRPGTASRPPSSRRPSRPPSATPREKKETTKTLRGYSFKALPGESRLVSSGEGVAERDADGVPPVVRCRFSRGLWEIFYGEARDLVHLLRSYPQTHTVRALLSLYRQCVRSRGVWTAFSLTLAQFLRVFPRTFIVFVSPDRLKRGHPSSSRPVIGVRLRCPSCPEVIDKMGEAMSAFVLRTRSMKRSQSSVLPPLSRPVDVNEKRPVSADSDKAVQPFPVPWRRREGPSVSVSPYPDFVEQRMSRPYKSVSIYG
ncbi:unnamed protein product [Vitrella brassicaformis CCMP3155]|uniref:Uncharacterized protein n=1 Tax=Vitrella brassicaformis (strain CCMP3155) TaxID=1169540 RepID=A0A0G4EY00_VITBC|nr:unnamed protein product [Vitrella brassicaformis CCMP3155]|eukprot:CEM03499.1 unnamed protein product [Vitrella brassicaformis CCMP3155]